MRPNDAYFELIADTLDGLESSARAQFLQRFFLALAHVEVPESKAIASGLKNFIAIVNFLLLLELPSLVEHRLDKLGSQRGHYRVAVGA